MPSRNPDGGPQCLTMLLCDGVVREPFTQKVTLVGVMTTLRLAPLPAAYPPLNAYIVLTNLAGRYEVLVAGAHAVTGRALTRGPGEKQVVTCDDPSAQLEVLVTFRNLKFEQPGPYLFRLTLNDLLIAERQLKVLTLRKPPGPTPPPASK